jgi:large subunit ribosomal protein L32
MTVRMRHTRAHTGNRRSHHALSKPTVSQDKESGVVHLRHRASLVTGKYKGRVVIDVNKKITKKRAKKDINKK